MKIPRCANETGRRSGSSSPAVAGDGTVAIGSIDAHLYAVRDGALKWSAPMPTCVGSADGRLDAFR